MNINFGCGTQCPTNWAGYDASPTLRLQRLPILGNLFKKAAPPLFESNINFGDIRQGLNLPDNSVELMYCSHVLEHLALNDLRVVLKNVYTLLKPGGVFRGVLPDLECNARAYLASNQHDACSNFMRSNFLGLESKPKGLIHWIKFIFGNANHLWMWDYKGLRSELEAAGFTDIREAKFGDSQYHPFESVENEERWLDGFGFECKKPLN